MRKKWISIICAVIIMVCTIITPAYAAGIFLPEESNTKQAESTDLIEAPSGILMEAQTGTVVYQKDADTRRSPASITKIMTLILIFDALDKGSLKMDDTVTTSAHAKSMGGSQVFLEEGEIQTVETLIKCIVIASGNDASVAMAEHICGSEQEFVRHMNERAEGLGMKNTHFEDCCGLTESPRSLHNSQGHCHHEQGTDHKISENSGIFFHMDGKYHPCDQAGDQGIRTYQYQQTDPQL